MDGTTKMSDGVESDDDAGPIPVRSASKLRICLAASGGGHIRQLLDLEPIWSDHDYFFVTESTALGESLAEEHRTYYVPHVAIGQARLGAPVKMLFAAVSSLFRSAAIIVRERPDVVISTGAGAVFFTVAWARIFGARTVVVESFARFDRPSLFARIAAPIAHHVVVQSAGLAPFFPKAKVFDPLRILNVPPPPKQPILFATVGATLPFDRMVDSVAELKANGGFTGRVIIQTGLGGRVPEGIETHETLDFNKIRQLLRDAEFVVCHGGTGSLITALREGCKVIAMPRSFEKNEHYDNHQAEITGAFAARGLIEVANTSAELGLAIGRMRSREPVLATTDPQELIASLSGLLRAEAIRRSKHPPIAAP